jgi:hypothetical protein
MTNQTWTLHTGGCKFDWRQAVQGIDYILPLQRFLLVHRQSRLDCEKRARIVYGDDCSKMLDAVHGQ